MIRPGGKELLVGESKRNRILGFRWSSPESSVNTSVLIDLPQKGAGQIDNQPDGIALDADGKSLCRPLRDAAGPGRQPRGQADSTLSGWQPDDLERRLRRPGDGPALPDRRRPGALFRLDLPGVKGLTILPQKSGQ